MMNRADRRARARRLNGRPNAMRRIEAQVNAMSADELHRRLVAQGVARIAPQDAADLYWVQCAYVRIAKVRRLKGGPDEALAAVTHEVFEATGLGMPIYR